MCTCKFDSLVLDNAILGNTRLFYFKLFVSNYMTEHAKKTIPNQMHSNSFNNVCLEKKENELQNSILFVSNDE